MKNTSIKKSWPVVALFLAIGSSVWQINEVNAEASARKCPVKEGCLINGQFAGYSTSCYSGSSFCVPSQCPADMQ
jgi:hypothetical protein